MSARTRWQQAARFIFGWFLLLFLSAAPGSAQQRQPEPQPGTDGGGIVVTPDCVKGCIPPSQLKVTPDGGSGGSYPPNTGSGSFTFYVSNYGSETDFDVSVSCRTTGPVTCTGVSPSSLVIGQGQQLPVTATFTVGAIGLGNLVLNAVGGSRDTGYVSINVAVPNGAPAVSLAPHNPNVRDYSKCVANCFDMLWSHTTPAYYSLGQPRSIMLVYNSATAHPTPVIQADVKSPASGAVPTSYMVQVQRRDNNAYLTLLNGQTSVYFAGPSAADTTTRVAAALDAAANGLGTGVYDVNYIVTANFASGPSTTTVTTTSFIVVDRSTSQFGAGWWVAGYQRVYPITGGGALVVEGDGSAFAYRGNKTPGGTSATLTGGPGTGYHRTYLDGSRVDFDGAGRMTASVDRLGNTTSYSLWADSLLAAVVDPMGKHNRLWFYDATDPWNYNKLGSITDPAEPYIRGTGMSMDANHRRTTITDPDGGITTLTYGDPARPYLLTRITNRAGNATDYAYDALNRLQSAQVPAVKLYDGTTQRPTATQQAQERAAWQPALAGTAATPKAAVRPDSAVAWVADPLGAKTTFRIDRWGGAMWTKDPLGRLATAVYDSMGRPTLVTDPNGHQTKLEYGFFLGPNYPPTFYPYQLSKVTDMNTGRVVTYGYDASYKLTGIGGDTDVRYFDYYDGNGGPAGALKAVRAGASGTTPLQSYWYDNLARVTRITYGDTTQLSWGPKRIQTIQYDAVWGNVNYVKDPDGNVTRYHFDALGRTDTTYVPTLGATGVAYNVMNADSVVRNALGQFTRYSYNLDGTLARLVDPKGQVYKWSRNALGALVAQHDLADTTKADSSLYDLAGRVRKVKTRRGDEIALTYDVLGRLLSRSGPDFPTDYFEYDPQNRYVKAWNAGAFDSLAYDIAGRTVGTAQRLGTTMYYTSYTYDTHGRVTNRSTRYEPTAPTSFASGAWWYSPVGPPTMRILAGISQSSTLGKSYVWLIDSLHYDLAGSGKWHEARRYNAVGLQVSDTFDVAATAAAFNGRFTYDSLHRLKTQVYAGRPKRIFTYDSLGRLINACDSVGGQCVNEFSNPFTAYRYDEAGNRLTGFDPPTIAAPGNRISTTNGWQLTYDANGNLVAKCGDANCSTGNRYVWDALSRLKEVRTAGNALIASFTYDALGRRTVKTVGANSQYYLYDGNQVIQDIDAYGQTTREYAYYEGTDRLLGIKQPDWTGVAITDPVIGTVRGLARADGGAPLKNFDMAAWGKVPADTGATVPVRMGGQRYDVETGLYYMRARYYDPDLGRFLGEDPIGIEGGLNLYAYAGNDPVNHRDPSGTEYVCMTRTYTVTAIGVSSRAEIYYQGEYVGTGPGTHTFTRTTCAAMPGSAVGPSVQFGGGGKPGGSGGGGGGGESNKQNACRAELFSLAGNLVVDGVSLATYWVGGALLTRGLAKIGAGALMDLTLTINQGIRVTGTRYVIGTSAVATRASAAIAMQQTVGSLQTVAGAGAIGVELTDNLSSPDSYKDDGNLDWASLIPGVGSWRAGKAYVRCRNGK